MGELEKNVYLRGLSGHVNNELVPSSYSGHFIAPKNRSSSHMSIEGGCVIHAQVLLVESGYNASCFSSYFVPRTLKTPAGIFPGLLRIALTCHQAIPQLP
jgi:hypothetical protein